MPGKTPKGRAKAPGSNAAVKANPLKKPLAEDSKRVSAAEDAAAQPVKSTRTFYLEDFSKTLFPLDTNRVLVEHGEAEIQSYILKCLDDNEPTYGFTPQRRVFVSKPNGYLRRTVKLDVVAEYYIYDVIFRNRARFRKPHMTSRTHYGYRFKNGVPIAATLAYKGFKGGMAAYGKQFKHSRSMDVATYFNSLYHHDIVNWFRDRGASETDTLGLGQLLREIASGRSIDCLPQGLYPTKMIGNDFMRFVEEFHDLKSEQIIRFMDDIVLFADEERAIGHDFHTIQRLIGERGLSLNPRKTRSDDHMQRSIDSTIDDVKRKLLRRRRVEIAVGYDEGGVEFIRTAIVKTPLTQREMTYVEGILDKPDIEEADAELLLAIMRSHASRLERHLPYIMSTYPHLAKNVYEFCAGFEDKETLADLVLNFTKQHDIMPESQLFWLCAILADKLMSTSKASALIALLHNHRSATVVTRAKLLEIPDLRFGLQDLRNEQLANGQSDWLGWASAAGSRVLKAASRNHSLKYWGKASNLNNLVATIILKI